MPTTSPSAVTSGPPELPGLAAASNWIRLVSSACPRANGTRAAARDHAGGHRRADAERKADREHLVADAREEIFGPVLSVLTFRTPTEAVEKANNTPSASPPASGPTRARGSCGPDQLRAGVVWANTFNKFDPTAPSAATRSRATAARAAATVWRPTLPSESRIDVRKTYKLYVGGAFPRSESGRSYVVEDAKGRFLANAAHASRKDARDAVQAARKAFAGWSTRTPYNRGQVVYRVAEVLEGRRAQFAEEVAALRGDHPPAGRDRRGHLGGPARSGTPAGPTRSPRSSAAPTRWPGRTSTSRSPSPPAWWPWSPRRRPRCWAWSAWSPR